MSKSGDFQKEIKANRLMWNETAIAHGNGYVVRLKEKLKNQSYINFDDVEAEIFEKIGLQGKAVLQLCCNNGQELISIKRSGANFCLGVDISDEAIKQAEELRAVAGHTEEEIAFVCSDVYELGEQVAQQFDLLFISVGAFGWLPDLDEFFIIAKALLKPDAQIFIYEMHPVLGMYSPEEPGKIVYAYFDRGPFRDEAEPDYYEKDVIIESEAYWFQHTLGDIFTALSEAGFVIEHFQEYGHDISAIHQLTAELMHSPPMAYSLIAKNHYKRRFCFV